MNTHSNLSVFSAILIGHLVITLPILLVFGIPFLLIVIFFRWYPLGCIALPISFVVGWLWWAYLVPRWRMWALKRGADAHDLQWWAVATMLVYPKGWIFEKTELRPKNYDDGLQETKPSL